MNTRTGATSATDYSIDTFTINDSGAFPPLSLHFSGGGFTVTTSHGVVQHGHVVGQMDRINANVSGTGDYQGGSAVIEGTITAVGIGTQQVAAPIVTS